MEYIFYNLTNYGVTIHKKNCYEFITYNGIEKNSKILGHALIPKAMTFKGKTFEEYEVHDGL
jgi:hypothetical protein